MKTLRSTSVHLISLALLIVIGTIAHADTPEVILETTVHTENESTAAHNAKKVRDQWLEIHASSPQAIEGLKLRWTLFASELQRGANRIVVEESGEKNLNLDDTCHWVTESTPKVSFAWVPQHMETTGSGRRARGHRVEESGHRYYGYRVEVLSGDKVLAACVSQQALLKEQ